MGKEGDSAAEAGDFLRETGESTAEGFLVGGEAVEAATKLFALLGEPNDGVFIGHLGKPPESFSSAGEVLVNFLDPAPKLLQTFILGNSHPVETFLNAFDDVGQLALEGIEGGGAQAVPLELLELVLEAF